MTTFFDFFYAALPWVSIGIIVVLLVANSVSKPSDTADKTSKPARKPTRLYIASVIAYLTSFLLWIGTDDVKHSPAIVWLCIGSMFLCIASASNSNRN